MKGAMKVALVVCFLPVFANAEETGRELGMINYEQLASGIEVVSS
jgi:hypothetical protein